MSQIPKEIEKFPSASRERVRQAIARALEEPARADKHAVRVTDVRSAAKCEMAAASGCLAAWREGKVSIAESWADASGQEARETLEDLERRVRAAESDGDREALAHELAALLAGGRVAPDVAREIRGALGDARASAEKKRELQPPQTEAERLVLVGEREAQAALSLFYMVSAQRRDRLLAMIEAELAADLAEHPNTDAMGGQR